MKVTMLVLICLVVATFVLGAPRFAAAAEEQTPIAVGQKAPTFTLTDHNGKEQSLEALLKNGKVALVFYRSASW